MRRQRTAEKALKALAERQNHSPYACRESDGDPVRDWQRWLEECIREAGIPNFRWRDIRHTFAARLAKAGVPLRTLAELLGHMTLAMVMRYAHLAPAHLRDAVEKIAAERTDTTTDTRPASASEQRAVLLN